MRETFLFSFKSFLFALKINNECVYIYVAYDQIKLMMVHWSVAKLSLREMMNFNFKRTRLYQTQRWRKNTIDFCDIHILASVLQAH